MVDTEQVRERMTALGPMIDELEYVGQEEDGKHWVLELEDGASFVVHLDDVAQKLTFSTDIGVPSEAARAAAYEKLLVYNRLWPNTGGVRMSLDEPSGSVQMSYQLFRLGLDDTELISLLTDLIAKAKAWRSVIEGLDTGLDSGGGDPADDPTLAGPAMRV
ncbi:MAG: type III secretion system chaperone [Planctomycetota bacterium]